MSDRESLLQKMIEAARGAGEIIRSARDVTGSVHEKTSQRDLVTKYDLLVQEYLQRELSAILPEAGFLGEEGEQREDVSKREWVFIVDPIDGTTNFIQGFHNSCVSIGLVHQGQVSRGVVYNPYDGELYAAEIGKGATLNGVPIRCRDNPLDHSLLIFGTALYYRELVPETLRLFNAAFPLVQDIRRFGSAALDLCYLAAGKAGAFYECRLCPWDYAAGSLIAREAGCIVTQLDGSELDLFRKCSVLAGSPKAYDALLARFATSREA